MVVPDVPQLLAKLDGRTVRRFDGRTVVLRTADARVVPVEMNWRQRWLSALAHPNIAYLLLSLGMLGLTIELWNPGSVLPGVAGGLCLLLAFFTFQVLPVNYAGVLLILFGIVLFILEIKVVSHGVLSVGGVAEPAVRIDDADGHVRARTAGQPGGDPAGGGGACRRSCSCWRGWGSCRSGGGRRPARPACSGRPARALDPIAPGAPGRVSTHGEIWNATASEPIATARRCRHGGRRPDAHRQPHAPEGSLTRPRDA